MTDLLVPMPDGATGQKDGAIILAASIGRFAGLDTSRAQLESKLELLFAAHDTITFSDITTWLSSSGVKLQVLGESNVEVLHAALQQQNAAKALGLLAISDASKLIELEDVGDGSGLQPHPFSSQSTSCILLRQGYSQTQDYGYYSASLPGDSRRLIKLTWSSLVAAGITAATAILPPAPPVDHDALHQALHIMEAAVTTFNQARDAVLAAIGHAPTAEASPAQAEAN